MISLPELIDRLDDIDLPLRFTAPGGAPGPGYHLTEVRLSRRQILDCGGQRGEDLQAELQLMAGFGRPMTARRFAAIAARALRDMPDLAEAPLVAEVPDDQGILALLTPANVKRTPQAITIALAPRQPACRAVERAKAAQSQSACCG